MNHIFYCFYLWLWRLSRWLSENPTLMSIMRLRLRRQKKTSSKRASPPVIKEVHEVWVTAYSSTPEETDDTPFITASGKETKDGVLAANFLPFGTRVIIPEVTGDKVFIVEDRMHRRKTEFVDVWMSTKEEAVKFGIVRAKIAVLD